MVEYAVVQQSYRKPFNGEILYGTKKNKTKKKQQNHRMV